MCMRIENGVNLKTEAPAVRILSMMTHDGCVHMKFNFEFRMRFWREIDIFPVWTNHDFLSKNSYVGRL